jgi:hypothetical protein
MGLGSHNDRGIVVIEPRGELLTAENVREPLSIRDFMDSLRGGGIETGGQRRSDRASGRPSPQRWIGLSLSLNERSRQPTGSATRSTVPRHSDADCRGRFRRCVWCALQRNCNYWRIDAVHHSRRSTVSADRNQSGDARKVPEDEARRLFLRATEIESAQSAGLSLAELREVAVEAGIAPNAFEQAVVELAAVPPIADPGQLTHVGKARSRMLTALLQSAQTIGLVLVTLLVVMIMVDWLG